MKSIIAIITVLRGPDGSPGLDIKHYDKQVTIADNALIILLLEKMTADMKQRFFEDHTRNTSEAVKKIMNAPDIGLLDEAGNMFKKND